MQAGETVDYARRLAAAGASAEFDVHPGCVHGFERVAPRADVVVRAMADRVRVLQSL